MATINDKMTAIANAIRTKTGKTAKLNLDTMASDLNAIAERTSSNLTASGATVTVPAGNYKTQATKSVATATQATPSISVNSSGLITASATQTAGYVSAGTKSGTKQLTTKAAATITPGTSNKTIAAGTYLTGVQTIAGDADLKASNIKKGVNIFGVAGSYDAASATLNFSVVGGTSQPSSPAENTIWINTSTTITGYYFSAQQPQNMANGEVWITIGKSSTAAFDSLKENTIMVYPNSAKQMVNGVLINKTAKSYQNGKWVEWIKDGSIFIDDGVEQKTLYMYYDLSDVTEGAAAYSEITNGDGYIAIKSAGYGYFTVFFYDVDLTYADNLVIEGSFTATAKLHVWSNNTLKPTYNNSLSNCDLTTYGGTLDVKDLSGLHQVGITWGDGTIVTQNIENFYFT